MSKRGFRKDKFFYGYKGEVMFQQTFPKCKKLSRQADFRLQDCLFEIGRSRILEKRIIVYYRKLFYNIKKEHHGLKKENPNKVFNLVKDNLDELQIVNPNKFYFVYFTNNLKHFAFFDYNDLLKSELKKKVNGEYYFHIKVPQLYKTMHLYDIVDEQIGLEAPNGNLTHDYGIID